jgi:predicted permease
MPIVSAVAILSLALGIGANSAIFSILDSLLLKALPVERPEQLVLVTGGNGERTDWTGPIWEAIRVREDRFGGALAWSSTRFNLARGGETELVDGLSASGRLFDVLGVPAVLGRTFTAEDGRRGGGPDGPVAVISHGFWQRRFGGATDVIGRTLTVEGVARTIVGITPPGFFGLEVGRTFDVAIPLGREWSVDSRSYSWLNVMLRLKEGQDIGRAQATLQGIQSQIRNETLPHDWRPKDLDGYLREGFSLQAAATGGSALRERYRRPLTTIMVVVGLLLLIACANIANLLLARATARRHEISIRSALGASRWRIARQLLAESLVLSAIGALVGLAVAQIGSRLLVAQLSTSTNTVFLPLDLDWRILGFTGAVAVTTAILFGTAPAFRSTRTQPQDAIKAHGRGVIGDSGLGVGSVLVVLQVALSLVLVVGAGLFMRTFASLATLDLGFDRDPVLVASIDTTRLQLEPSARPALFQRMLEAAASVPGVAQASLSAVTPVTGSWQFRIELPDGPDLPEHDRGVFVNLVTENWFRTYGISLLVGRDFTHADTTSAPPVVIVNEAFARRFAPGRNAIGARVREPGGPGRPAIDRVIIGLVEDAVYRNVRVPAPPTIYLPFWQQPEPSSRMSLSLRAAGGSPALLIRPLAAALGGVSTDLAITFRPLADQVNASLIQERLLAGLAGFFGGLALLLAGLGLYGVTAYGVTRRRAEMGIRLALGASPRGVTALVLRRVAWLVGLGVVAGTAASLWASRFVSILLYGLEPYDPATIAGAIGILAGVGMLSGWLPARRASRIDPMRVLRES